jgi:hypothetical protein
MTDLVPVPAPDVDIKQNEQEIREIRDVFVARFEAAETLDELLQIDGDMVAALRVG